LVYLHIVFHQLEAEVGVGCVQSEGSGRRLVFHFEFQVDLLIVVETQDFGIADTFELDLGEVIERGVVSGSTVGGV